MSIREIRPGEFAGCPSCHVCGAVMIERRTAESRKAESTAYGQGAESYAEWLNEHAAAPKVFDCLSCGATTEVA